MKRILAALLASMLVLAGCGGGSSSAASSSQAVDGASSEAGAASESTEAVPETTTPGVLVVGMECNYAPFNWTQLEEEEYTVSLGDAGVAGGYDVRIAQAIADELGMELQIKKLEWTGLEPALYAGEIDAIIAGMTDTPERRANADFTGPYYESEMVCIVRGDDELVNATTLADFSGKTVQGQLNTLYDEVIDQIPDVTHATPLASYPFMVVALQNGEVDALTAELPVARGVVAANPDLAIVQFAEGEGFEADTSVSIAVKKGNTALLDKIQGVLDGISQDERNEWMQYAVEHQPAQEE